MLQYARTARSCVTRRTRLDAINLVVVVVLVILRIDLDFLTKHVLRLKREVRPLDILVCVANPLEESCENVQRLCTLVRIVLCGREPVTIPDPTIIVLSTVYGEF